MFKGTTATTGGATNNLMEVPMRVVICLIALVSATAAFAVSGAGAKAGPSCPNIRTYQQAAKAGEMPAIVSALHGGAPITNPLLSCPALRQ